MQANTTTAMPSVKLCAARGASVEATVRGLEAAAAAKE